MSARVILEMSFIDYKIIIYAYPRPISGVCGDKG